MKQKYGRFFSRDVFNGIGSRRRNGMSALARLPHSYGFAADMRQRFQKRMRAFIRNVTEKNPRTQGPDIQREYRAAWREFIRIPRQCETVYYGQRFILNVCYPYVVVTLPEAQEAILCVSPRDGMVTGNVVAVFPV